MKWSAPGLNIFLSVKVSDLPPDLFSFTSEQKTKTLCLVGHGGKALWEELPHPIEVALHPFDQYTTKHIKLFAKEYLNDDYEILFPNDAYTLPLQKIGRFLNLCTPSPIGLDMSHEFGLWFAFRGVFLTNKEVSTERFQTPPSVCTTCVDRPCLKISDISLARLSCPEKNEHQYRQEQLEFHHSALKILKV